MAIHLAKLYAFRTSKSRMNLRLTAALLAIPTIAQAHPGHSLPGFTGGLLHPVMGVDHLLAALAVGLWAAQSTGRSRWMLPLAFVLSMGFGLAIGISGFTLASGEMLVMLSVIAAGLLIARAFRPRVATGCAMAAALAWAHGLTHAAEAPVAGFAAYATGIFFTTAALHLAGLGIGASLLSAGRDSLLRRAGTAIAIAGLVLRLS